MARKPRDNDDNRDFLDSDESLEEQAKHAEQLGKSVADHLYKYYEGTAKKLAKELDKNLTPLEKAIEDLQDRQREAEKSSQSWRDNIATNLINQTGAGKKYDPSGKALALNIGKEAAKLFGEILSTRYIKPIEQAINEMGSAYESNFSEIAGRMGTDRKETHRVMHDAVSQLADSVYSGAINANKELIPALKAAGEKGFKGQEAISIALANSVDQKIMPWLDTASSAWANLQFNLSDNQLKSLKAQQLLLQESQSGNRLLQTGIINKIDSDLAPILSNIDYNTMDKEKLPAQTKAIMEALVEKGIDPDQAYAQAQKLVQVYRDPTAAFRNGGSVADIQAAMVAVNGGDLVDIQGAYQEQARQLGSMDITGAGMASDALYGGAAVNLGRRPEDYLQQLINLQEVNNRTDNLMQANGSDYDSIAEKAAEKATATQAHDNKLQNSTTDLLYDWNSYIHGIDNLNAIKNTLFTIAGLLTSYLAGNAISSFVNKKFGKLGKVADAADDLKDAANSASKLGDAMDVASDAANASNNAGKLAKAANVVDDGVDAAKTAGKLGFIPKLFKNIPKGAAQAVSTVKGIASKALSFGDEAVEAGAKATTKSAGKAAAKTGGKFVPLAGDVLSIVGGVSNVARGFKQGGVTGAIGGILGAVEAATGAVGAVADLVPGVGTAVSAVANGIGAVAGIGAEIALGIGAVKDSAEATQSAAESVEDITNKGLYSEKEKLPKEEQPERNSKFDSYNDALNANAQALLNSYKAAAQGVQEDVENKKATARKLLYLTDQEMTADELKQAQALAVAEGLASEAEARELSASELKKLARTYYDSADQIKDSTASMVEELGKIRSDKIDNEIDGMLDDLTKHFKENNVFKGDGKLWADGLVKGQEGYEDAMDQMQMMYDLETDEEQKKQIKEMMDDGRLKEGEYKKAMKMVKDDVGGVNTTMLNEYNSAMDFSTDSKGTTNYVSEVDTERDSLIVSAAQAAQTAMINMKKGVGSKEAVIAAFQKLADLELTEEEKSAIQTGPFKKLEKNYRDAFKDEIPSYAVGTPWVSMDGIAKLHEGEAVIPKTQNTSRLRNLLGLNSQAISQNKLSSEDIVNAIVSQGRSTNDVLKQILSALTSNRGSNVIDKVRRDSEIDTSVVTLSPQTANYKPIYRT